MCENVENIWYGSYGERQVVAGNIAEFSRWHLLDTAIFLMKFGLSGLAGWRLAHALPVKPWAVGGAATVFGASVLGIAGLGRKGVISGATQRRFNLMERLGEFGFLSVGLGLLGSWSLYAIRDAIGWASIVLQTYPVGRILRITPELLVASATFTIGTIGLGFWTYAKLRGLGDYRVDFFDSLASTRTPVRWG